MAIPMNKKGKTITIFLFVVSILLISLMAITLFLFQKEREMRKANEAKLTQAVSDLERVESEYLEAKKQSLLLEEKTKQSEQRLDALMNEVEVEKGLKDVIKKEKSDLETKLTTETKAKEGLVNELAVTQQKIADLEEKLKEQEKICRETEKPLSMRGDSGIPSGETSQSLEQNSIESPVALADIPEGKVLSINLTNNFIVLNLGSQSGISAGLLLSIYRGEKYLGDVQVSRVQTEMSVADILPPLNSKKIRKNDRVLVKK